MGRAFTPRLRAEAACVITKIRELPIPGEVLVGLGDTVVATQAVGRALLQGDMRIVRVAEELGVPARDVRDHLRVKIGDRVASGESLAEMSALWGLVRNVSSSPSSGVVEFASETTGHVGIRSNPRPLELSAYLSGTVKRILPNKGAEIEGRCAFLQGIFGVGGERMGTLKIITETGNGPVTESSIPSECAGAVLVSRYRPTIACLRAAANRGAVGFVTGSIDDTTLREYVGYDIGVAVTGDEDLTMSVIITEGFGELPMSERIEQLLRPLDGKPCSINGTTQVRAGAVRPEIIVSLGQVTVAGVAQPEEGDLTIGTRIRCIRVPFFGELGVVTSLPHELTKIETGAWARVLRAKLDTRDSEVSVPRANVERI